MILVDSNVAIDSFNRDAVHNDWSAEMLTQSRKERVFINAVIVAELAVRAISREHLEKMLDMLSVPIDPMDTAVAFRAGQAFADWIDNGGRRGAMIPDFLIGAHASVRGARVLTRDPRRFRAYFPEVGLIVPDQDND